jgi:hypothetical protein
MSPAASGLLADQDQSEWQIEWQMALARVHLALVVLVAAGVLAGQALYLWQQNPTVIHGKEKVYGSIP